MLFPDSKRVVFQTNPLIEVICQLRFPTILEIASQSPISFQNKVRVAYPLYEKEDIEAGLPEQLPKQFAGLLNQIRLMGATESPVHKFLTADSSRFISIASDFIAVTERKYKRWEQFLKEVITIKAALEEIYKPAFYTRVGLRYQDVIDKNKLGMKDIPWKSLINESLIGLLGADQICNNINHINSVATLRIDEVPGGLLNLRQGLIRKSDNTEAYRIDADFYTEGRSNEDVSKTLSTFNRISGNLFRWATTNALQTALKPVDIS